MEAVRTQEQLALLEVKTCVNKVRWFPIAFHPLLLKACHSISTR